MEVIGSSAKVTSAAFVKASRKRGMELLGHWLGVLMSPGLDALNNLLTVNLKVPSITGRFGYSLLCSKFLLTVTECHIFTPLKLETLS